MCSLERPDGRAVVEVVRVHREQVLVGVPLDAPALAAAVGQGVAGPAGGAAQVDGHALRQGLGLDNHLFRK